MSDKHTQGRLVAKVTDLMLEGGRYRMASHITACGAGGNMKQDVDAALANARRLAACWNACEGFDTDLLLNIDMMGDTLKQRFEGMQAEVRRVDARESATRQELANARALLLDIVDRGFCSDHNLIRIRAFLNGGA